MDNSRVEIGKVCLAWDCCAVASIRRRRIFSQRNDRPRNALDGVLAGQLKLWCALHLPNKSVQLNERTIRVRARPKVKLATHRHISEWPCLVRWLLREPAIKGMGFGRPSHNGRSLRGPVDSKYTCWHVVTRSTASRFLRDDLQPGKGGCRRGRRSQWSIVTHNQHRAVSECFWWPAEVKAGKKCVRLWLCTYINVFNCVVVEARKVVHARMPCLRVICCTHTVNSKIGRQLRCLLYCSAYALLDIHVYVPTQVASCGWAELSKNGDRAFGRDGLANSLAPFLWLYICGVMSWQTD